MTYSMMSHAGTDAESPGRVRVECVLHENGDVRLTIEVRQAVSEHLVPGHNAGVQPAAIGSLVEEIVGALLRAAGQSATPRPDEPDVDDAEEDARFEQDLEYVLDKNAELYKRLAQ